MATKVLFVGLDVDDKNFHGAFTSSDKSLAGRFKSRPSVGALVAKIKEIHRPGYEIKICYEASYLGFSLWRDLKKNGYECAVISPNHIPKMSGVSQKTDRLDAERLAEYYSNGLLTSCYVPTEKDESVRALVRAREGLSMQMRAVKKRIIGLCRINGFHYKQTTSENHKYANHWTVRHLKWLDSLIKGLEDPILKLNFNLMMLNLNQLEEIMAKYDLEIERLAVDEAYNKQVQALRAFRGIDTLGALTLVIEIGDVKRFDHPKKLTSYAGLDIREYSSGGRENKFGISRMGSKYIRTRVIESCQTIFLPPKIGKPLQERRKNVPEHVIKIADKCMLRLHSKAYKLLHKGKHRNKIKVACAREMLCFAWEALQSVAS